MSKLPYSINMIKCSVLYVRVSVYGEELRDIATRNRFFKSEQKAVNYLCEDIIRMIIFDPEERYKTLDILKYMKDMPYADKLNKIIKLIGHNISTTIDTSDLLPGLGISKITYHSPYGNESCIWNIEMCRTSVWSDSE